MPKTDKRDRSSLFRTRLAQAIDGARSNQSALARSVGVDRSTISQLLSSGTDRLPNAQIVAECAAALGVSADWLLGLSDRPEQATDLLAASMEVTKAERAMVDEQVLHWFQEAEGYKIRHVPARLPDILKTESMLAWEYAPNLGRTSDEVIQVSRERLDFMRHTRSDFEIAIPLFELASFVSRTGYYEGLPQAVRDAQVEHILELQDQLYPSMRVFMFDARRLHAVPVTIFGPHMAVLYTGEHYMAFRDLERVDVFIRQFDRLVREAHVSARDLPDHIETLLGAYG